MDRSLKYKKIMAGVILFDHPIEHLKKLLFKNFNLFMVSWFGLACTPLLMSFIFDYVVYSETHLRSFLILAIMSFVYISSLLTFFSISIWVVFTAELSKQKKIMVIIVAYVLIWFAFGNFYFATFNVADFYKNLNIVQNASFPVSVEISPTLKAFNAIASTDILNNVATFWRLTPDSPDQYGNILWTLAPVNRLVGYIDCLYFSATTILTIGFGDITPATAFLKTFVIIEGFLGQIINVLAIGLWLSKVNHPVDEDIY